MRFREIMEIRETIEERLDDLQKQYEKPTLVKMAPKEKFEDAEAFWMAEFKKVTEEAKKD